MKIHFAPMQGYADHVYRRLHNKIYGGIECYYTPFIRVEKGEARRQDIRRLQLSIGDGTNLVPQIIFNSFDEFQILIDAVKTLGFKRIDLNLGCPFPLQTKKGRGAAMVTNTEVMGKVAAVVAKDSDVSYSIKMRLGVEDPDEWRVIMPLLNDLPLCQITMHPRVASQMYGGDLYCDKFNEFKTASSHPVIWNGDILTLQDINVLEPDAVMIGRGLLARPSLAVEYQEGKEWSGEKRMEHLLRFHNELYDEYSSTLCGPTQILQHIKPFWEYMGEHLPAKFLKAIRKSTTIKRYLEAVRTL